MKPNDTPIIPGALVKFREIVDPGDAFLRYTVVRVDAPRAMISTRLPGWAFPVTQIVAIADIVPVEGSAD